MTRRLTAVELDAALAELTAKLAELTPAQRNELRASMPAGIMAQADQANAAQAQSIGWTIHDEDDRVGYVPPTAVDEWLRLGLLDTVVGWVDGRGRTCMHSPHHTRPQPVFAAAWRPNLVVCAHCLHLLDVTGPADRICDCCGHLCDGIDADDPIYTGTVWLGELAYEFGTCGDCRPDLGAAA
jgi:hypothetical protein